VDADPNASAVELSPLGSAQDPEGNHLAMTPPPVAGNSGPWNTPSRNRKMNKSGIIKAIEKPPITIKPVIIVIKDDPSVTRTSVVLGPIFSEIRPPGN
jgi:hypothetical protein